MIPDLPSFLIRPRRGSVGTGDWPPLDNKVKPTEQSITNTSNTTAKYHPEQGWEVGGIVSTKYFLEDLALFILHMLNYSENCVHSSQDVFFYILITIGKITFSYARSLRWLPHPLHVKLGKVWPAILTFIRALLGVPCSDLIASQRISQTSWHVLAVSENSSTMVGVVAGLVWTLLTTMIIISFNSKQFSLDYFRNTQRPGNLGLTTLRWTALVFSYLSFEIWECHPGGLTGHHQRAGWVTSYQSRPSIDPGQFEMTQLHHHHNCPLVPSTTSTSTSTIKQC